MTWYQRSNNPRPNAWAESAKIRREFGSVQASFDLWPDLTDQGGKLFLVNVGGTEILTATTAETGLIDSLVPGRGLGGGGNAGEVQVNLDWSEISAASNIASENLLAFHDGTETKNITFGNFRLSLNMPNISGGVGLSGGPADSGNVTIDLDLASLPAENAIANADFVVFYDPASGGSHKRVSLQNFRNSLAIEAFTDKVTTFNAGEGIGGGGNTGVVSIHLDLTELQAVNAIALTDTLPFTDVSAVTAGNPANRKVSVQNFLTSLNLRSYTFGDGLTVNAMNEVSIDLPGLSAVNTVADTDVFVVVDISDGNALHKISKADLQAALGITVPVSSVTAGNGLSGGGNSGDVTVNLNISGIATTANAISDGDFLAFSNEDVAGDPTEKITKANFRLSLGIPDYTGQHGIVVEGNNISTDFSTLTVATTLAGGDFFPYIDISEGAAEHRKMTYTNLRVALDIPAAPINFTAGVGIALSNNAFSLNLPALTSVSSLVDDDKIVIYQSSSSEEKTISVENFKAQFPIVGAGTGVNEADDLFSLDLSEIGTVTSVATDDFVVVQDGSASGKILVSNLVTVLKALV